MTTITPGLLAKIKAKAEKAMERDGPNGQMYGWDHYRMDPTTTLTLVAALEEAQRERDHWRDYCDGTQKILEKRSVERDALRAENEKLRAALEPFAIEAPKYDPPEGDDDELPYGVNITIGNLRRARTAAEAVVSEENKNLAVVYENDTGPNDEGFSEWWEVRDGDNRIGRFDTESDATAYMLALARRGAGWAVPDGGRPMLEAPKDGTEFVALSEDLTGGGLPPFFSLCAWHPDAGFCTDEIREPTRWWPINLPDEAIIRADERERCATIAEGYKPQHEMNTQIGRQIGRNIATNIRAAAPKPEV